MAIVEITVADLTTATLPGLGVFDVLMRANKAHLDAEFLQGRIKGPEYSTVYLGSLQAVMSTALQFLLSKQKLTLEAELLEQQILLAQVQVTQAQAELALLQANLTKVPYEILKLQAEISLMGKQEDKTAADIAMVNAQKLLIDQQALNAVQTIALTIAQTTLVVAEECEKRAQFNLIVQNTARAVQETALLARKIVTETAQTDGSSVTADSVVGRQNALYVAQSSAYARDAELKVAKELIGTWNTRQLSEGAQVYNTDNKLTDNNIGNAIAKMMSGIGASYT
jgi:hypothetical protein